MLKPQTFKVWALSALFLIGSGFTFGQATINVRVVSVEVTGTVDCDAGFLGIGDTDSDFVWEFLATDNTLGFSNNNPVLLGILGDFNFAYNNNSNGPYTMSAPGSGFSPTNGLYFQHDYVCAGDIPTSITIDWRAYENDEATNYSLLGLLQDGETANQSVTMAVPATPGNNTQTFEASSTDGGCPQTYRVTFQVEHVPLPILYLEDNICDAWEANINQTYTLGWCPTATLETNEPQTGDISSNGSVWVKFTAPASGEVEITTDLAGTEFGTYFQVYHAADGGGCNTGLQPITGTQIKDKFDYLSHHEFSDGIDFLGADPEAEIDLDACNPVGGISYQKVHAGETYYVQLTSDNGGERGYYEVRVNDLGGGSPPNAEDIPCNSPLTAVGTAEVSSALGSPASMNLGFGCSYDGGNNFGETGDPHGGSTNPNDYHAYDYDHGAANNGTMNESVWMNVIAPNSGRLVFETDYQSGIYSEDAAFFGYDKRFAPGTPADYSCANLENLAAQEGGLNGLLGGAVESAIITQQCLEPGYAYYGMVDPANNLTLLNDQDIDTWVYDPSVIDPVDNPPGNDILCLTMLDPIYEVPVTPAGTTPPFNAVAGSNERACREYLAGEPDAHPNMILRADQTVWHYFTVPPSGAIEMNIRAYIGMDTLRYAMYELLNGTDCYGGLNPATYTNDGTQSTPIITPVLQGSAGFNGNQESVCCLTPGSVYAIQLDGGSPGDEGQYIIEYIREIESYAGDTYLELASGEIIDLNSTDTAFVCFSDTLIPGNLINGIGLPTLDIPSCLDPGFVMHSTLPIPDPVSGSGFTFIDTIQGLSGVFVNNTDGSGTPGNPLFNTVYYVSSMADDPADWANFNCPTSTVDNAVQVVYLQPMVPVTNYDPLLCQITFTATGGLSTFYGTDFSYTIQDASMTVVDSGTFTPGSNVFYQVVMANIHTITITDGACPYTFTVDASVCGDPCITNPIVNYVNAEICDGQQILLGGSNQTTAGVYTDVFTALNGCDSTVYTTLSILPHEITSNYVTICQGDSYTIGGNTYTTSGQYTDVFLAANGCDSIVTTNLFVETEILTTIVETICTGQTYNFDGNTLNASGVYVDSLTATGGCDSIVTLHLTVTPLLTNSITETICEGTSTIFGSQTLSSSGTYTEMFATATGCDSMVTMYLFVTPTIQHSIAQTICEGQTYTLGTQSLTTSGTYSELFTTASGCDSLVQLFLTVSDQLDSTINVEICLGDTYQLGSQTLDASGVYSEMFTTSGGCDSLVTLELTVLDCQALLQISNVCTPNDDGKNDTWKVSDLNQIVGCEVKIFNRWGQPVFETSDYQNDWDGTKEGEILPDGVYYYSIICEGDRQYQGPINLLRLKK